MLSKTIRILNFDDSVIKQRTLLSKYAPKVIDLTRLGPEARFWINPKTTVLVEKEICHSDRNSITFLGSGDFHHISEILISRFDEPISVIDFDFHPDWDILFPRLTCGSWVKEVLRRKNIMKAVLIGISSNDISNFHIQMGDINSLNDGRLEIYPYRHAPTRTLLKKISPNPAFRSKNGVIFSRIYWTSLEGQDLAVFFRKLLDRISTKKVYVSIDKDCLKSSYAATNWEEGKLSLKELLLMLRLIKQDKDIIGLDITGDYSDIIISNAVKRVISLLDHPWRITAKGMSGSAITALNEDTNLKILEHLF